MNCAITLLHVPSVAGKLFNGKTNLRAVVYKFLDAYKMQLDVEVSPPASVRNIDHSDSCNAPTSGTAPCIFLEFFCWSAHPAANIFPTIRTVNQHR